MNNSDNRKVFQHLPVEENPQFLEDGLRIYKEMKDKYPKSSIEDLDNILNGLCVSLVILIKENIAEDNRNQALQLIYKALSKNI